MNSAPERRPIGVSAWNSIVDLWLESWASFADPARQVVAAATALAPGTSVLDLGCGSGEFLALAAARGAEVAGIDDAGAMIAAAHSRVPHADLRVGSIEELPWPDDTFDVVTAFNAIGFADDRGAALAEARRVARNGGLVAVSTWGADRDCEVQAVAVALERLAGGRAGECSPRLGEPGIIDALAEDAGLSPLGAQDVSVAFEAADEAALQRAFLLDAILSGALEHAGEHAVRTTVAEAAGPYRRPDGSYRFENVFRVVVARAWRGSYRLR
jgi:SAM-dependent methyltransferase